MPQVPHNFQGIKKVNYLALHFSPSLNFPTAVQWHNRAFVSCLEELFVNCFASRTASFVDVLPKIQKVVQQREKLKKKVIFISGVYFERKSFQVLLYKKIYFT